MQKRLFIIILAVIILNSLLFTSINAEEETTDNTVSEEVKTLIEKSFGVYTLLIEGDYYSEYFNYSDTEEDYRFVADDLTKKATEEQGYSSSRYCRMNENYRTNSQLEEHFNKYFSSEIANYFSKTKTYWVSFEGDQVLYTIDGKLYWDFEKVLPETITLVSEDGDTSTYSCEIKHNTDAESYETVTKTFVIRDTDNGPRIVGGTFVTDLFGASENPATGDATMIILSAAALISLAVALVFVRKRRSVLER